MAGGGQYNLWGPSSPQGGLGPIYVAYFFVFLGWIFMYQLYKLTLSYVAHVALQLTVFLP